MNKGAKQVKTFHWITLAIFCVALSACAQSTTTKSTTTSQTQMSTTSSKPQETTSSMSTQTTTQTTQAVSLLWDAQKKQELAAFMQTWGESMNQQYTSYDEAHSSNYAGLHFPADFGQYTMAVDEVTATIAWSTNGLGEADYNVVAVYCDVDGGTIGGHLYLFAFTQTKEPVVLITEQNQAMPDNRLHFTKTKNKELQAGFVQIARTPVVSEQTTTSEMTVAKPSQPIENSKLLAAKVWIKHYNLTTAQQINSAMQALVALDVYSAPSLQIWSTGVMINKPVTVITASPLAGGMVTYHNNEDGTVMDYPIPTHFQDKNWDDPVKGKQMANDILDQAKTLEISDISDELAEPLAKFMTGEISQ